jgi:hypothetical protein
MMDEWSTGGLIADRRKHKYSGIKPSHCHFVHYTGHIDQYIFDFIGQ